jgi:hypothetical protein
LWAGTSLLVTALDRSLTKSVSPLWTYQLSATPGGVALARESDHVLTWDLNGWLVLVGRHGRLQAQVRVDRPAVAAVISEDGSAVADADDKGVVTWRTPDLAPRWRHRLGRRPTALVLDALGRALAVADAAGQLWLIGADGRSSGPPVTMPRPIHHLAFAPTAPALFAAADFGLVTCVDLRQRRPVWQDAPVIHLGGLVAAGEPATAVVASFSEGVRRYALTGQPLPPLITPEPCRFVATTFVGRRFLTGGVFGGLHLLAEDGSVLVAERIEQPMIGLALTPLGDTAVIALADGRVIAKAVC